MLATLRFNAIIARVIKDAKKWNLGISKLSAFMTFTHEPFDEDKVGDFHAIITTLEEASGEDLSHFKVSPDRLRPNQTTEMTSDFSTGPPRTFYSDKKYCEPGYFRSQIDGLGKYVAFVRGPKKNSEANPYDSLSDHQLQDLLLNRRILPKRVIDHAGEHYVYDRTHAIAALLKYDRSELPSSVSNVFNIRDSNIIHSSPSASINENIGMRGEELRKILDELKKFSATEDLSPDNRIQMNVDIGTIELQATSPHPNPSIIKASLESAGAIAQTAAGTLLGEAALIAIKHYLGVP